MKQMTCAQMGGPITCEFVASGNTAEEMVTQGFIHVKQSHPELAATIQNNSAEENEKWMAEFRRKFDAISELK